jgi:hypothetical protein
MAQVLDSNEVLVYVYQKSLFNIPHHAASVFIPCEPLPPSNEWQVSYVIFPV